MPASAARRCGGHRDAPPARLVDLPRPEFLGRVLRARRKDRARAVRVGPRAAAAGRGSALLRHRNPAGGNPVARGIHRAHWRSHPRGEAMTWLPVTAETIPVELRNLRWVLWRAEP